MKGSLMGIVISLVIAALVALAAGDNGILVAGQNLMWLLAAVSFLVQWLAFVPAYLFQTEKFYDLTGSLTYISLAILAVTLAGTSSLPALLIAGMVVVWAVRLGSFLFLWIRAGGQYVRFTKIKPDFLRFLMTWTLQGLWVFLTFSAGLVAITAPADQSLNGLFVVGGAMWVVGFAIEVVADRQKRQFRALPENREKFINHGLWQYSRHPNYFGEILLWSGIAVAALPMLSGWQHVTLVSPLFVYVLLTQVSGVKLLEARGQRRWGDDPAYQAYLEKTPVLVPRPWR